MLSDLLTRRTILPTKNGSLEETIKMAGAHIPGRMKTHTIANSVDNENENVFRYSMEILNTLTHGSALPDHRLSLKKGIIVMLLRSLDAKNGHVRRTVYVVGNMTNHALVLWTASANAKRHKTHSTPNQFWTL